LDSLIPSSFFCCITRASFPSLVELNCRFCQKCGKLEDISSFESLQRSCRASLELHNKRRREKSAAKSGNTPNSKKEKCPAIPPRIENKINLNYVHQDSDICIDDIIKAEVPEDDSTMEYKSEFTEATISLKFHHGTPEDLPVNLFMDLPLPESTWCEGSIRPGCTHLSVRVRVSCEDDAASIRSLNSESLALMLCKKWKDTQCVQKGIDVQLGTSMTHVARDGSSFTMDALPHLTLTPSVVPSSTPVDFIIGSSGLNLQGRTLIAFCRQNGRYLTTSIVGDGETLWDSESDEGEQPSDSDSNTASSRSVSHSVGSYSTSEQPNYPQHGESKVVARVFGLEPGSCEVELMVDNALTTSRQVLVLPTSESILEAKRIIPLGGEDLIRDVGLVVRHVCSTTARPSADLPMIQKLAVSTTNFAMEHCCYHLVRILQEALPPSEGCCSKRDTDVLGNHLIVTSSTRDKIKQSQMAFSSEILGKMSYETRADCDYVAQLVAETSRLEPNIKQRFLAGSSWKNLAFQLLSGIALILLVSKEIC
jgi:hypothetical protein